MAPTQPVKRLESATFCSRVRAAVRAHKRGMPLSKASIIYTVPREHLIQVLQDPNTLTRDDDIDIWNIFTKKQEQEMVDKLMIILEKLPNASFNDLKIAIYLFAEVFFMEHCFSLEKKMADSEFLNDLLKKYPHLNMRYQYVKHTFMEVDSDDNEVSFPYNYEEKKERRGIMKDIILGRHKSVPKVQEAEFTFPPKILTSEISDTQQEYAVPPQMSDIQFNVSNFIPMDTNVAVEETGDDFEEEYLDDFELPLKYHKLLKYNSMIDPTHNEEFQYEEETMENLIDSEENYLTLSKPHTEVNPIMVTQTKNERSLNQSQERGDTYPQILNLSIEDNMTGSNEGALPESKIHKKEKVKFKRGDWGAIIIKNELYPCIIDEVHGGSAACRPMKKTSNGFEWPKTKKVKYESLDKILKTGGRPPELGDEETETDPNVRESSDYEDLFDNVASGMIIDDNSFETEKQDPFKDISDNLVDSEKLAGAPLAYTLSRKPPKHVYLPKIEKIDAGNFVELKCNVSESGKRDIGEVIFVEENQYFVRLLRESRKGYKFPKDDTYKSFFRFQIERKLKSPKVLKNGNLYFLD